jgi:hypothetical protein
VAGALGAGFTIAHPDRTARPVQASIPATEKLADTDAPSMAADPGDAPPPSTRVTPPATPPAPAHGGAAPKPAAPAQKNGAAHGPASGTADPAPPRSAIAEASDRTPAELEQLRISIDQLRRDINTYRVNLINLLREGPLQNEPSGALEGVETELRDLKQSVRSQFVFLLLLAISAFVCIAWMIIRRQAAADREMPLADPMPFDSEVDELRRSLDSLKRTVEAVVRRSDLEVALRVIRDEIHGSMQALRTELRASEPRPLASALPPAQPGQTSTPTALQNPAGAPCPLHDINAAYQDVRDSPETGRRDVKRQEFETKYRARRLACTNAGERLYKHVRAIFGDQEDGGLLLLSVGTQALAYPYWSTALSPDSPAWRSSGLDELYSIDGSDSGPALRVIQPALLEAVASGFQCSRPGVLGRAARGASQRRSGE